jgi:hypothetical protein
MVEPMTGSRSSPHYFAAADAGEDNDRRQAAIIY